MQAKLGFWDSRSTPSLPAKTCSIHASATGPRPSTSSRIRICPISYPLPRHRRDQGRHQPLLCHRRGRRAASHAHGLRRARHHAHRHHAAPNHAALRLAGGAHNGGRPPAQNLREQPVARKRRMPAGKGGHSKLKRSLLGTKTMHNQPKNTVFGHFALVFALPE